MILQRIFMEKKGHPFKQQHFRRKYYVDPNEKLSKPSTICHYPRKNSFGGKRSNADDSEEFGRAFGTAWKVFRQF